jgi:hypothetical protein
MFNLLGLGLLVLGIFLTVREVRHYRATPEWGRWIFVKVSSVVWVVAALFCAWLWARPLNTVQDAVGFHAMALWGMFLGIGFGAVLGQKQGFTYGRGAALAGSVMAFGACGILLTLHELFG